MSTQALDPIAVIGAPLDLGAGRRGVDMGPSAIRYAGLSERLERLGRTVIDFGNVQAAVPEATAVEDERARFLPEIKATCERVAGLVTAALARDCFPLVLGGDHSVALGSIGAMAKAHGPGGAIWVDAHGDVNTPGTSPSGNVHGMVLAALLGDVNGFASEAWRLPALDPGRVVLVGVRVLDEGEKALLRERGVCVFTMSDVDRLGVENTFSQALERAAGDGFVHVSFDMDVVDPAVAPGVGTPVQGGLSYREAHLALEVVAESGLLSSLDVVEVNPILDRENATAALAVDLVASALGARILEVAEDYFGEEVAAHYDDELGERADVEATVDFLAALAGDGAALELGIGTGRVALPLAQRGVHVHGIDLSEAMVARLRAKPGAEAIDVTVGDFATTRVDGEFRLAYLVFNTVMNLTTQDEQVACFRNAAAHLEPGGRFVIETEIPDLQRLPRGETVRPFDVSATHLGFDEYDVARQGQISHHYTLRDGKFDAVSMPFRYVWPSELDLLARMAGMTLRERWAGWRREPFTSLSESHVSVWELPA